MVESVVQTGGKRTRRKKKKNGSPLTKTPFGERVEKNLTPISAKIPDHHGITMEQAVVGSLSCGEKKRVIV